MIPDGRVIVLASETLSVTLDGGGTLVFVGALVFSWVAETK